MAEVSQLPSQSRVQTPAPAPARQVEIPSAIDTLTSNMDAQVALAEERDRVCYAPGADGYMAAMAQPEGPVAGPLPEGGARSHPLEGNAVYEWGREGGGYDQATHPWRMFNDLAQVMVPGTSWQLPTPVLGGMRARR